jgi:hypothetical protein
MADDELDLVPMLAAEIRTLVEETVQLQQNLDAIEVEISGVAEALLRYLPDSELELVFVNCHGTHRGTMH